MKNDETLRITLLQLDLAWENKEINLSHVENKIAALKDQTDLVILPETCTTGFTMHTSSLAETMYGDTMSHLRNLSKSCNIAIAGSFIHGDENIYHNRAFLITPEGDCYHSDKRHLFRMGGEDRSYTPGDSRLIVNYNGWNILLLVCYDLRFPVWSRNHSCEYDLAIYVANWPFSRIKVWDVLLTARALENQAYVCGVNRIGTDPYGIHYGGHSVLINAKGEPLAFLSEEKEAVVTSSIDKKSLSDYRIKFPVWKDAD